MVSPLCQVKDGAGAYVATTNGVNVTPANTITINLIDTSADSWSITCASTDELSVAATVTAGLTINTTLKTATFTAPVAGRTYRFRSTVNGGVDGQGIARSSYSTTFCIYTLTDGNRVVAADESTEGGAFGWVTSVNNVIRAVGGAFASSALKIYNPAATFYYTIAGSAILANRTLTLPLLTGPDTVAVLGLEQTLSNKTLASPTIAGTVIYQGTKLRILSIPGEVQTTTATTAVIATFTMLDETSCKFDFTASMKAVGAVAKAGGWTGSATYYRTGGGAPTISNGTPNYGTAEETTGGDGVTFDVSGNAVRVLATAADGDDRNWTCEFRVAETLATA